MIEPLIISTSASNACDLELIDIEETTIFLILKSDGVPNKYTLESKFN